MQSETKMDSTTTTSTVTNNTNINLRNDKTDQFNLKCRDCTIAVKTKEERDEHIERIHHKIPCNRCDGVFNDLAKMKAHYKTNHLCKCLLDCGNEMAFNSVELLQQHLEDMHTFKCDMCGRMFTDVLLFHHHSINFQCHMCAIPFASKEIVQKHVAAAHKFQCAQCPRHFTSDTALFFHYDVAHALDACCHLCGDKFANNTDLATHTRASHCFTCKNCGMACETQSALNVHKYSATNCNTGSMSAFGGQPRRGLPAYDYTHI